MKSIEFVSVQIPADGKTAYSYQKFGGTPLKSVTGCPTPSRPNAPPTSSGDAFHTL